MVRKEDLFFVNRHDITSAYELTTISDLSEMAYHHFMYHEDEVLYLLNESRLLGILSIGDLERYYQSQGDELKINKKYTSVGTIDFDIALNFFKRVETINELPVATEQGEFLGVIKWEKRAYLRNQQRRSLKAAKTGEFVWQYGEIRRFANRTRASLFLYTYSSQKVMEQLNKEDKQKIKERRHRLDGSVWEALSEEEWKNFLGSNDNGNGSDALREDRFDCRLTFVNGKANFQDMKGNYYTIQNGYRFTPNNPLDADRNIFIFGPCNAFGAYCKDSQTIAAYLQCILNSNGHISCKVLNRGIFGAEYCYDQLFMEELSENDIVVVLGDDRWCMPDKLGDVNAFRGDLSEVFLKIPHLADCVIDSLVHSNYIVNEKLAEKIYKDICSTGILNRAKNQGIPEKIQNYYINWTVREYFIDYFEQYRLSQESDNAKVGAIVMNCNPFTKGHRYLIEQALSVVDKLYIFVVEEDKSYFKFQDRLRMVEQGVSGLENIRVVPSGKYIISSDTFEQYFEKDQVQTVNSMDYDVYIFGEVVAAGLGIQYRFVGEEPFDQVTKAYNETLKRILPDFGVKVVEIPRVKADEFGQTVISATLVRKALQENDVYILDKLCPESTITYLKEQLKLGCI